MPRPSTHHFLQKKTEVDESEKTLTFKTSKPSSSPSVQSSNALFLGLPGSPYITIAQNTAERLNMEFHHITTPQMLSALKEKTNLSLAVAGTIGLDDEDVRKTLTHIGKIFYIMADVSTLLSGHSQESLSPNKSNMLREQLAKTLLEVEPYCLQISRFILRPDAPYGEIAMDVDEKMRL